MFSLTGFPPLGGFIGKYAVFAPALESGLTWLVIIGVLASAVSAYYYLRVLFVFWMRSPAESPQNQKLQAVLQAMPSASSFVLIACVVLLIVLGVDPGLLDITAGFFEASAVGVATIP